MALLVFLTFLSLITNQYVPVWMEDAEAAHMGDALGQFGDLKTSIEIQMLVAQEAFINQRSYVPVTTFTSVKLGVDGVPIFAVPTIGDLRADEQASRWSVAFSYLAGSNSTMVSEANCDCGGSIRLQVFNRYYVPQNLAFENGAIVRAQVDGQIVKGEPLFSVFVEETSVQVDFRLVELLVFGSTGVTGFGTEGISSRLRSVNVDEYTDIQTPIDITARTVHGPAWYRFFNDTLSRAFGITLQYYATEQDESELRHIPGGLGFVNHLLADNPIYKVESVWDNTAQNYAFSVRFKRDVGGDSIVVLPIGAFRLLHAYVEVRLGT